MKTRTNPLAVLLRFEAVVLRYTIGPATALTQEERIWSFELNFADYNAHWFLADTYEKLGYMDEASREVTVAHLLNVNHKNLQKTIRYYLKKVNRPCSAESETAW